MCWPRLSATKERGPESGAEALRHLELILYCIILYCIILYYMYMCIYIYIHIYIYTHFGVARRTGWQAKVVTLPNGRRVMRTRKIVRDANGKMKEERRERSDSTGRRRINFHQIQVWQMLICSQVIAHNKYREPNLSLMDWKTRHAWLDTASYDKLDFAEDKRSTTRLVSKRACEVRIDTLRVVV